VEDRLNEHVGRFLASRRRTASSPLTAFVASWQAGLGLRAAAAVALLVSGIAVHMASGSRAFAASVGRMQESVALWKAIERSSSMACAGSAGEDLRSPAEFADRLYRRWLFVGAGSGAADVLELTFRSPSEGAQYELVVDRQSMLPRRVVKTSLRGVASSGSAAAGYDATCSWGPQTPKERTDGQR
jgi:hypothetical protein